MKKKTKTPEGNQNKKPENRNRVRKTGISFQPETWKLLDNYTGSGLRKIGQRE